MTCQKKKEGLYTFLHSGMCSSWSALLKGFTVTVQWHRLLSELPQPGLLKHKPMWSSWGPTFSAIKLYECSGFCHFCFQSQACGRWVFALFPSLLVVSVRRCAKTCLRVRLQSRRSLVVIGCLRIPRHWLLHTLQPGKTWCNITLLSLTEVCFLSPQYKSWGAKVKVETPAQTDPSPQCQTSDRRQPCTQTLWSEWWMWWGYCWYHCCFHVCCFGAQISHVPIYTQLWASLGAHIAPCVCWSKSMTSCFMDIERSPTLGNKPLFYGKIPFIEWYKLDNNMVGFNGELQLKYS